MVHKDRKIVSGVCTPSVEETELMKVCMGGRKEISICKNRVSQTRLNSWCEWRKRDLWRKEFSLYIPWTYIFLVLRFLFWFGSFSFFGVPPNSLAYLQSMEAGFSWSVWKSQNLLWVKYFMHGTIQLRAVKFFAYKKIPSILFNRWSGTCKKIQLSSHFPQK